MHRSRTNQDIGIRFCIISAFKPCPLTSKGSLNRTIDLYMWALVPMAYFFPKVLATLEDINSLRGRVFLNMKWLTPNKILTAPLVTFSHLHNLLNIVSFIYLNRR